jgi:hypothetical protein
MKTRNQNNPKFNKCICTVCFIVELISQRLLILSLAFFFSSKKFSNKLLYP